MSRYLAERLVQSLVVLAVMSFVIYGLMWLMPGDPIDLMIGADPKMTSEDAARLRELYGLDRPFLERYLTWLGAALSGDLGYSRLRAAPVLSVLWPALRQYRRADELRVRPRGVDRARRRHRRGAASRIRSWTTPSTCSPSPAFPPRRSGWRCC